MATSNGGLRLFGFEINRAKDNLQPKSFVPMENVDGGTVIDAQNPSAAAYNQYVIDIDPSSVQSELELIRKYRDISLTSDIDMAVDEIVNEVIIYDELKPPVSLDFSEAIAKSVSPKTKEILQNEFEEILKMLDFTNQSTTIVRNAYVDGRLHYHKVLNKDNPKFGVIELRPMDALKTKRIIEISREKDPATQADIITGQNEYFLYNDKGFTNDTKTGLKIAADAIAYVPFGVMDKTSGHLLSYLHKAIRPLNQLRMMEDAEVIYRTVRAPQRRVFYIDTNGMTKSKGEQHIRDVMTRFKNKQVYDANSGQVKDSKRHLTMLEDFWFPRNSLGKSTEITTLEGAGDLGNIENVAYFQNRLYQALNIPISRLKSGQTSFNMGRENEISRDEVKFNKFIQKLRRQLNRLFLDVLETNVILKGIASSEDWDELKPNLIFKYIEDNFYAEIKESEMFKERIANVQMADLFVGKYISKRKIQRDLLRLTDEEIEEIDAENQEDLLVQQKLEQDVLVKYNIDPNNPTGEQQ